MRGTSQIELVLKKDYNLDLSEMTIFEIDNTLDAIAELKEKQEQLAAQQAAQHQR